MHPPTMPAGGRRRKSAALILVASLGAAGCATASTASPAEVTRAQIAALAVGDEAGARSLLAEEARVRSPQWPPPSALPDAASVTEIERVAVWSGERELELVRGADGWTIRRGALALFRLDSPEGALAAFGRAIAARDLGLVQALIPEENRRQLAPGTLQKAFSVREQAWLALGRGIGAQRIAWVSRDADRAEVDVDVSRGDEAKGRSDEAPGARAPSRVVLVREESGWKVFDLKPWSEYTAP